MFALLVLIFLILIFIAARQEKFMADIDVLNGLLDTISTTLTSVAADSSAIESELNALQTANPSVDLSGVIAKAQAISAGLTTVDTGLKAAAAPPDTTSG